MALRMRKAAGQLRLFCPSLDHRDFYIWRYGTYFDETFDEERYLDAKDRHDFNALFDDGESTFIECAACGLAFWESHPPEQLEEEPLAPDPHPHSHLRRDARLARGVRGDREAAS